MTGNDSSSSMGGRGLPTPLPPGLEQPCTRTMTNNKRQRFLIIVHLKKCVLKHYFNKSSANPNHQVCIFPLRTSQLKKQINRIIIYFNNIFPKPSNHINNLILMNKWGKYADYYSCNDYHGNKCCFLKYGIPSIKPGTTSSNPFNHRIN